MKVNQFKKMLAIVLTLTMLFSAMGLTAFADENSQMQGLQSKAGKTRLEQGIDKTTGYFTIVKKGNAEKPKLDNFWQMAGMLGAGLALENYDIGVLESSPSQHSQYFHYKLLGDTPMTAQAAIQIAEKQNTETGALNGNINFHIWNMVVLDMEGTSYDSAKAVVHLLGNQKSSDGSFGLNGASDADVTGMALLALANHKGEADVDDAIKKAEEFLKTKQSASGGFTGLYGENINTVAAVVSGLIAAGQDLNDDQWKKDGVSIADYVLSTIQSDGRFGNDLATEQGLIAMMELSSGKSLWKNLGKTIVDGVVPDGKPGEIAPSDEAVQVSIRIEGEETTIAALENEWVGNFDLKKYGLSNTQTVSGVHVLIAALEKAGYDCTDKESFDVTSSGFIQKLAGVAPPSGDWNASWFSFVNNAPLPVGSNGYSMTITEYPAASGDELVIYYLKNYGTGWFGHFDQRNDQINVGEPVSVHLQNFSINDVMWGNKLVNTPVEGAVIQVDGADYEGGWNTNKTDKQGNISLQFMKPGIYTISAKLDTGIKWLTRPLAKITVAGKNENKTIRLRVEGSNQNLAYDSYAVIKSDGRKLSVMDALNQVLTAQTVPYEWKGSMLESVKGEANGKFGGWDGWMYLVNRESPSTSTDRHMIENGDEIVFYYGLFETLCNTKLSTEMTEQGLKLTLTGTGIDETYTPVPDMPGKGVTITAFGAAKVTDEQGTAVFEKNILQGKTQSTVVIDQKDANGAPLIVRLAPDDMIKLTGDGTLMENKVAGETPITVVEDKPLNITVKPGSVGAAIAMPSSGKLPQLAIKNDTIQMNIAAGTEVKTEADEAFTGEMKLPAIAEVTLSGNKVANVAIKAGLDSKDLYFSKPIRLVIPGGANLHTAMIDSEEKLKDITVDLSEDTLERATEALTGGVNEAKIKSGYDMVVWTNHLSTYLSYTVEEQGGNPGENSDISLYVEGVGTFAVPYTKSLTPLSILVACVDRVEHKGGYVSGINGKREFDQGPGSGWMYSVNGTYYKTGAGTKKLESADDVEWRYTKNFGDDLTGTNWSGAAGVKTEADGVSPQIRKTLNELNQYMERKPVLELSDFEIMYLALNQTTINGKQLQQSLIDQVSEVKGNFRKVTDISRIILAARTVKLQPSNIGGYDMVNALVNHKNIQMQGVNGPAFALIAYDAIGLRLPSNAVNSRENLKSIVLEYQNADGGFSLAKQGKGDPDVTAMVLTALAPYKTETAVKTAVEKGVSYLAKQQQSNGGFISNGVATSESVSQTIIALCSLGIDPLDRRFVKTDTKSKEKEKTEITMLSNLYSFRNSDGGFSHIAKEESNTMATEQAGLAFLAYEKFANKKGGIYEMKEASYDVFKDKEQMADWAIKSVLACQSNGLMSGDLQNNFMPKKNLTRAEASKIITSLMQLEQGSRVITFQDVREHDWFAPYVNIAASNEVVTGVGNGGFNPQGEISRQDFAVMLSKALGLKIEGNVTLSDIDQVSEYAKGSVVAVFESQLMKGSNGTFDPKAPVSREMIAVIMENVYEKQFK